MSDSPEIWNTHNLNTADFTAVDTTLNRTSSINSYCSMILPCTLKTSLFAPGLIYVVCLFDSSDIEDGNDSAHCLG